MPSEIRNNPESFKLWEREAGFAEKGRNQCYYPLQKSTDGSWTAEGVAESGSYDIWVCWVGVDAPHDWFLSERSLFIPAAASNGTIDLGEVRLKKMRR